MRAHLLLVLLLSACASAAPSFLGSPRRDVVVDGIPFVVFLRESEAEVIRMGYLGRRDRARVPPLMVRAAEEASGCRAIPYSVRTRSPGDTGEARISLRC